MDKKYGQQIDDMIRGFDAYLDEQQHSEEAYEKSQKILETFDFMVQLAVSRALGELYNIDKPYEAEQEEKKATIINFTINRRK